MEFLSEPFSRKVSGRDVSKSSAPISTLMWTQTQPVTGSFSPNHFVPLLSKSAMSRVTCTIDLSDSNSEAHNVVDELDLTEPCQPDVSCEMQSDVTISSDSNMSNETVVDNEQIQNMSNETVVDNEQNMTNQ